MLMVSRSVVVVASLISCSLLGKQRWGHGDVPIPDAIIRSSGQSTICVRSAVPRPSCTPLLPARLFIDRSDSNQRPKCVSIYDATHGGDLLMVGFIQASGAPRAMQMARPVLML